MVHDMVALSLTLQPRKSNTLPRWLGRATQAFFLQSLKDLHPDLSAAIHDNSHLKPFTASNLIGGDHQSNELHLSPSKPVHLRFTTLHPHLSR